MITGYPKKAALKGGTTVILRPLDTGDEGRLVRFFARLPPENTQFLKDDVGDPEVVRSIAQLRDPGRVVSLLAITDDDRVAGAAMLHVDHHGWRRHVGEVRVVVAPEFQKQRLATTLIAELVNQASLRSLQKLEAQILDVQADALAAFEHLGFREEARLHGHAMDHQGELHDLLILTNSVDDLWRKMENLISDLEFARG
jgi:RimJ/RimL family protein N-acetyltransferase